MALEITGKYGTAPESKSQPMDLQSATSQKLAITSEVKISFSMPNCRTMMGLVARKPVFRFVTRPCSTSLLSYRDLLD